jgi:hypothetical protein
MTGPNVKESRNRIVRHRLRHLAMNSIDDDSTSGLEANHENLDIKLGNTNREQILRFSRCA